MGPAVAHGGADAMPGAGASQNHRTGGVGKDLKRSAGPTPSGVGLSARCPVVLCCFPELAKVLDAHKVTDTPTFFYVFHVL